MSSLPEPHGLRELIAREVTLAHELLALLEAESHALRGRDAEAITSLSVRKHALVDELDGAAQSLATVLRDAGIDGDEALDRWLAGPAGSGIAGSWRELTETLAACRQANARNGGAIRMLGRFNERLLDLVQGHSPAQALYDNGGRARRLSSNRYATRA